MPYVFLDAPADSSELETYHGYQVARCARVANGGPVRREDPFAAPTELILHHASSARPAPRRAFMPPVDARPLTRFAPGGPFVMGRFLTTPQLAGLLSIPSLCFIMVWLIGRL